MREGRSAGRIDGHRADSARCQLLQHTLEAFDIECFGERVFHRFPDQGMIGNWNIAGKILRAPECLGKHRGQQVFGAHPRNVGRHLPAGLKSRQGQRPGGVPSPARGEQGSRQRGLFQQVTRSGRREETKNARQREAVLLAERKDNAVVRGGGLQFEVE